MKPGPSFQSRRRGEKFHIGSGREKVILVQFEQDLAVAQARHFDSPKAVLRRRLSKNVLNVCGELLGRTLRPFGEARLRRENHRQKQQNNLSQRREGTKAHKGGKDFPEAISWRLEGFA